MRDHRAWAKELIKQLRAHWPQGAALTPYEFCAIELGLHLMRRLAPETPIHALWALLIGYPFPGTLPHDDDKRRMLAIARHLLPAFRSPFQWRRALERYQTLPDHLRGYDVDADGNACQERHPTVAANRQDTYAAALRQSPPYRQQRLHPAKAERLSYWDGRFWRDVDLSEVPLPPPPESHPLTPVQREPITVDWDALIETARWMDCETAVRGLKPQQWEQRMRRVRLEIVDNADGKLNPSRSLTIDGLFHLIGMVSSGKSTLMDVLAVWMARAGRRTTIIVGDVISALERADRFVRLGLPAAPILGSSNRERHLRRLHRVLAVERPFDLLAHDHHGFAWLSTVCPLDALRDQPEPLDPMHYPCQKLFLHAEDETSRTCPLYGACPSHRAQRDLVDALIWVTTPAGFIYPSVAPQINIERIRFAELAARRSDLVIIDEADRVQVQFDAIFSPNQTLVGQGEDSWLGRLWERVVPELNTAGRGQLREEEVARWVQAHETVQMATNRIYTLLLCEPALQKWIDSSDYFTDWLLFERIAQEIVGKKKEYQNDPVYHHFMGIVEAFLDDPLGERRDHPLVELAYQGIGQPNYDRLRARIGKWIDAHHPRIESITNAERANLIARLEFALLVTILQNRLDMIFRSWKQVEAQLQLEGGSSLLFHRPPDDYGAVIPAAPMGNVLAFQYVRSADDPDAPGNLRFFRCMGVGRWLMLHLPYLFTADGYAGPHTLLLSGSSWAIGSDRFHVQARVNGILRTPEHEVEAIEQSVFEFLPMYDPQNEYRPIKVSGMPGEQRMKALKSLLCELVKKPDSGGTSLLERTRNTLPPGRQRALLLVGSYDEALHAADYMRTQRPDWKGQVIHLVPDDDEFESQWSNSSALQRGLVAQFGVSDAWILVAPLLAIERGHNILNERDEAAIGAVYFLVRPHPRPDDIASAIHAINRWAIDHAANREWYVRQCGNEQLSLLQMAETFRWMAYRRWRTCLRMSMQYSTLPREVRKELIWTQLVTIWQVIGRLVRGGRPARVFFCDAAFAPRTAGHADEPDTPESSLLVGMREVLHPYFSPDDRSVSESDRLLVQTLYGPFFKALETMRGLAHAKRV